MKELDLDLLERPDEESRLSEVTDELIQEVAALLVDGLVVIDSQEKADYAAAICSRIDSCHRAIGAYFDEDIATANALHKSLLSKRNALDGPLMRFDGLLRAAIRLFVLREEQRRTEAVAQFNATIKDQAGGTVVAQAEPTRIAGFKAPTFKFAAKVTDKIALLKAVVKRGSRIPIAIVSFDEGEITRLANKNGGKLDWPGVSIEKTVNLARKER